MNTIKDIKLSNDNFIVETEKSSLKLNYSEQEDKYLIDISDMNIINATKTAIFCSTYCFIKNFKKRLCWLVKDEETKRAISILCLKNVEQQIKNKVDSKRKVLVS